MPSMMDRLPQPSSQPFQGPSPPHHPPQSSSSSSSLPPFHPQTAQPPVQIPFSDPFHNRDPFLPPTSQRSRRESYGVLSGVSAPPSHITAPVPAPGYGERAWSTQPQALHHQQQQPHQAPPPPPPPPPPSAAPVNGHPSAHMSNAGYPYESNRRRSIGNDHRYGPIEHPPPPPPQFSSRNMPPPSPTSGPTPGSAFPMSAPRHTPSASPYVGPRDLPGFGSRPGATMSISSLIGQDSSRSGNQSPRTTATAPSPPLKPIHPPSPQRARSASTRVGNGQFQRPHSPPNMLHGPRSAEAKTYHTQSYPPPPFSQPSAHGFRHFQSSPPSAHLDEQHTYASRAPSRPNSQPMHAHMEQEMRHRQEMQDRQSYHPAYHQYSEHRQAAASQPPSRQEAPEMNGHSHHHQPHPSMSHTARSTPAPPSQPFGRTNYPVPRDAYSGLFRPALHGVSREEVEQRGPHNELLHRPEHRHSPTVGELEPRQKQPTAAHYALYGPPPYELRDGEENPLQRAFLGVASDLSRKNGRASPLPQAVQGAQPRHIGPGADPGVKSEFGRMFSGLGSGVGSNTPTAGISTPSRLSPASENDGRKARSRLRDEGNKDDSDSAEGRNTPTAAQRSKRTKTSHPPHHHHHHPHAHHHHHHHHEEQIAHAAAAAAAAAAPFNPHRFPSNPAMPQQPPAAGHHHHHHHHHVHQPHHHHHNQKLPPAPVHRKPATTVSNQALLQSVSKLSRKHLGSQLYSTKISLPPRESTPLDSKYHFKSSVKPIPRFEGKDNCTFTIRVPRAYLSAVDNSEDIVNSVAGGLEEICRTRAVWGSDVYSDDSDPVAAAVHSGWIRGDFGEYNEDLRDLFNEQSDGNPEQAPVGKIVTEKPKVPLKAPPNTDLHVTVLLLPALTHYMASTQNFLRSREWGPDHDGVSYMIHSVEFVDESNSNRYTERNAAAKHRRIKEDLARRREAAESLLGLMQCSNSHGTPAGPSVSVGA